MTWTGATSTTVTSVTIQHDESTAFQAAITALASSGGTIYVPDGLYLVNGPLQDTGGANAVLQMPKIVYETSPPITITITGFTPPAGNINTNFGSVLQTSQNTGNFIGGYDAASSTFGPFTNVVLEIDKLTLRGPANPGVTMINGTEIGALRVYHTRIDTTSNALGANTAGTALIMPTISNDLSLNLDDVREAGYYTGYLLGEHTHAGSIYATNAHDPFIFDTRGSITLSNAIAVDYLWEQGSVCGVSAGTQPTVINVQMADLEGFSGNGVCDASNRLFGMLNWHVVNGAALNPSGGTNLQLNAMAFGYETVAPNGANNGTIDFGGSFGHDAVILFNGGASNTYGWGLNAGEMQFHISSSPSTTHFSWNGGGNFNPSGTNELMRLYSTGDLSIGTTTDCSALLGVGSGCHFIVDSSGNATAASLKDTGVISANTLKTNGSGTISAGTFPWSCQPGYGDGLNAITAGTYLQSTCYNDTGQTITLTALKCFSDNNGTSSMNATNGAGTALLTGAITCTTSFAAGTQSATTTIASGDFIKFTFVADGTTKQSSFVVAGTHP